MLKKIKEAIGKIDKLTQNKNIKVVSHYDADGVTSAAIFSKALNRWGKRFSLEIVKGLDREFIAKLPEDDVLIFLDLASGSLDHLGKKKTEVFIFDHHEVIQEIPANVIMINPTFERQEPLSGAAISYLFAKELSEKNRDLAVLAVIGMVGDLHEKNIGKIFGEILRDSETLVKKGLLIYPSTRPLDRALEYSSNPFIPGVSGFRTGVLELLRDAGVSNGNGRYKALYELNEEEMMRLITAVVLRGIPVEQQEKLVGNLFLVKFFNNLEDARELSALINACSRMDYSEVALGFCLGSRSAKNEAEKIYIEYKQNLVSALRYVSETNEKLEGRNYLIINARDKIKDTIIGTVASILSYSPVYPEGLVIVALSYVAASNAASTIKSQDNIGGPYSNQEKIKVSARIAGRNGRNVREVLNRAVVSVGGEVGGHPNAAGCIISKDKEEEFINELKRLLEIETVRV